MFPRSRPPFDRERLRERLAAAGLQPERAEYTSYLAVPARLDGFLARLTERLGRLLEKSGRAPSRWLADQVVDAAR